MDMPSDRAVSRRTLSSSAFSLAGAAAVIGPLVYVVVTLFHPAGADANNHPVVFREYAASQDWIAIHLVQLACLVLALAGIAGLAVFMLRRQERGRLLALLGVGFALGTIPIAAVLQVVDGIGNKRLDDAWVAAGAQVGSATFAAAQGMRWLEEGSNAVFSLTLGLAVLLVGVAMARGSAYPRWWGWIGAIIGIAVFVHGILVAQTGFSPITRTTILAYNPILWIWTVVSGVLLWRRARSLEATLPASSRDSDQAPDQVRRAA